jgi:diguanylate cyclase (GGDEF)-like protein
VLASPRPLPASPPLAAKIVLAIVLAGACAFAIATFVHRTIDEINDASIAADHTYDLITRVEGIEIQLLNLESGQRGYLLTGDQAYLAPYRKALTDLDTQLAALRALSAPQPAAAEAVTRLGSLVADKTAELEKAIAARTRGLDAALAIVRTGEGERLMNEIRGVLAEITQQQWDQLEVRQTRKREILDRNVLAMAAVAAITALLIAMIAYFIYEDVAQRRRHQRAVAELAFRDALTGLPTRAALEERLAEALEHGAQYSHGVAVLIADLDDFKRINDTHGRAAGDRTLVAIATRLAPIVRGKNLVARFPDDRFGVLLAELAGPHDAAVIARKMLATIGGPVKLPGGNPAALTASIGISLAPEDGTVPATLVGHAEAALNNAKTAGKNTYRFYRAGTEHDGGATDSVVSV